MMKTTFLPTPIVFDGHAIQMWRQNLAPENYNHGLVWWRNHDHRSNHSPRIWQTDRRMDRLMMTKTVLCIVSRGKNGKYWHRKPSAYRSGYLPSWAVYCSTDHSNQLTGGRVSTPCFLLSCWPLLRRPRDRVQDMHRSGDQSHDDPRLHLSLTPE